MPVERNNFPQITAKAKLRTAGAVGDALKRVHLNARDFVPVDEGDARDSIKIERESPFHGKVNAGEGKGFHALFLEFGATQRPATPFLLPAAEVARHEFNRDMRRLVD